MSIPLPKLLRQLRNDAHEQHLESFTTRMGIALWAAFARRPSLYRVFSRWGLRVLRLFSADSQRIRDLPFGGGWTDSRDLPQPTGETFMQQWQKTNKRNE